MSEKASPMLRPELLPIAENLQFGSYSYEELLDAVGSKTPEVAAKKDDLLKSAHELVKNYEVKESFFAADDNAIGLLLAAGLHYETTHSQHKSEAKKQSDQLIADNFARTLLGPYSDTFPLEDVYKTSQLEPADRLALHEKYMNLDLSRRLQEWFLQSEEMREVRDEMTVAGKLRELNVIVLGVSSPFHTKFLGQAPDAPDNLANYISELHACGEAFMAEQKADPEDVLPYAYATVIFGKEYMCFMEPTAKILLEPETVGYQDNGENLEDVIALMKHEFVHAQGRISLVGPSSEDRYIGQGLEEYRAEVFSGQKAKRDYYDMYNAVLYVEAYTGAQVADIMKTVPAGGGGDKVAFYSLLIKETSLATTAKLASLIPKSYINFQSPKSSRVLFDMLTRDKLMKEVIADMTAAQLTAHIKKIAGTNDDMKTKLEDWLGNVWQAARA